MATKDGEDIASATSTALAAQTEALAAEPATNVLPADDADCIELYFELDSPAERDLFLQEFARRPSDVAAEFLRTALTEDPDPFIRVQAAAHLARRNAGGALEYLANIVEQSADTELVEAAMAAYATAAPSAEAARLAERGKKQQQSPSCRSVLAQYLARLAPERAANEALDAFVQTDVAELDAARLQDELAIWLAVPAIWPAVSKALVRSLASATAHERATAAAAEHAPADEGLLDAAEQAREGRQAVEESIFALQLAARPSAA